MSRETVAALKSLIANELDIGREPGDIEDSAPFFEDGMNVDSIAIVELIVLIEERFGIIFEDAELVPETFQNVRVLADRIDAKLSQAQQDALA